MWRNTDGEAAGAGPSRPALLYVLKHFPCLSQTFVLNEIRWLLKRGVPVHIASAIDAP